MRIISGKYKRKSLNPPSDLPVRPTTDFAKTGLFNILNQIKNPDQCDVLDLFAGTGNISLEFLSRGASKVVSVDSNKKCLAYIRKVSAELKEPNILTIRDDVLKFLAKSKYSYDIIFADPPYDYTGRNKLINQIFKSRILKEQGIFILEHPKEEDYTSTDGFLSNRRFGHVTFSFFHSTLAENIS